MQSREAVIRIVALALLIYSLFTALNARLRLGEAEEYISQLSARLDSLEEDNRQLVAQLDAQLRDGQLRKLAWDKLGLVMPDETVFYFVTDRKEQK